MHHINQSKLLSANMWLWVTKKQVKIVIVEQCVGRETAMLTEFEILEMCLQCIVSLQCVSVL